MPPARPAAAAAAGAGLQAAAPLTLHPEGRAALLHAVAHIEFNAINLALDAVWRFAGLPEAYYRDWLRVAAEEALHFTLLRDHLQSAWATTTATSTPTTACGRWSSAPRTTSSRAWRWCRARWKRAAWTPRRRCRPSWRKAGDARAVEILGVILRDEVGHVAIGNRWYRWLCERDGLDPLAHYAALAATPRGAPAAAAVQPAKRAATPDSAPTKSPQLERLSADGALNVRPTPAHRSLPTPGLAHHDARHHPPFPADRRPRGRRPAARRLRQEGRAATRPRTGGRGPRPGTAHRPRSYVVGTDAAYAPFECQNEKGEIVGFDIDVVKAVAAKAGIEVKFVNTPWEGIFNALGQGDRDMIVSAVTITDERKQTMDFSDPYFDALQLIAVKDNSKVAKFADLKKLKVGVQTGTTGDEAVTKLLGKTSTKSSASSRRRWR